MRNKQSKEERRESNKIHQHNYWLKNKDRYRKYRKEQIERGKKWLRELKTTLKCSRCEENHPACLQFHHLNPEEKEFNIAEMTTKGYSQARVNKELEKCVVLCANCHAKEHYVE